MYSFGIGFGDISPAGATEYIFMTFVLLISSIMNALILAQFASPIIDEEIVNYDLYCRLRNEKLVRICFSFITNIGKITRCILVCK